MFVFTRWWSFFGAAVALGGLLGIAHLLIRRTQTRDVHRRHRGAKALVIGADGRASTSKLQVLMWTLAVLYALTVLLLWGRSIGCDDGGPECEEAATVRGHFEAILEEPLETEYYALLGLPTAAAVAAKALTVNKVAKGEVVKQPVAKDEAGGVGKALAEVVSADNGRTDLIDFQYFGFNLLALLYFALQFLASPGDGLPEIPPTLIALTGVAVAAYTGKKALENDAPAISSVLPRRIVAGEAATVTVVGNGFGSGGVLAIAGVTVPVAKWDDRKIVGDVAPSTLAGLRVGKNGRIADLTVVTSDGAAAPPHRVEIERPDDA